MQTVHVPNDAITALEDPGTETVIITKDLSRSFDQRVVLDHVSFHVDRREIFGLIGPNGAGKSTLIKMLTTLLPPTSGDAVVCGHDIRQEAALVRASIGYVPQLLSADGGLTGYENLLLSARLYLIPRKEREQRIEEALEMTELSASADRLAQHYSGGMLRRLEIAQSTLHRPSLLIMDEPTVGLDPVARMTVWRHIKDLRQRFGTTILITTHVMDEVEALCDRVGILNRGRLELVGTPAELKAGIGPDASLEDVFASVANEDIDANGNFGDIRLTRRGTRDHA